jgi:hypothetical protein
MVLALLLTGDIHLLQRSRKFIMLSCSMRVLALQLTHTGDQCGVFFSQLRCFGFEVGDAGCDVRRI